MAKRIGIIAEDKSDIAVLDLLISKLARKTYSIKSFVGNGCGKIPGKCRSWAENLSASGCQYLLVVHDLDQHELAKLRTQLQSALKPSPIAKHEIVIPVREIEAWLLADHNAITRAMNLKDKAKRVTNPEGISDPKKFLGDLVFKNSRKSRRYVNAIDNKKIAKECSPVELRKCSSFIPFGNFISQHLA